MAILTLPRGPVETTRSLYAGSRQAVHVLGILSWGAGLTKPQQHFYIAKCKEKGSLYSLSVFRDWLERQDLTGVKKLHGWSDGGRHVRCNRSIATIVVRGVEALIATHNSAVPVAEKVICEVETSFGVPSHFKNEEDGEFNYLITSQRGRAGSSGPLYIYIYICKNIHPGDEHGPPDKICSEKCVFFQKWWCSLRALGRCPPP